MSDPAKYRPKGELEEVKEQRDPLKITENRLTEAFNLDPSKLGEVKESVETEAQAAWEFAESSPKPDPANLYDYVYTD